MQIMQKALSLVLCFLLIFSACFVSVGVPASALYKREGYINDDMVNIRSGAGTGYESLGKLAVNTKVLIKGVGFDGNGVRWYQLTAYAEGGDINGFVHSDYVTVIGSSKSYKAKVTKNTTVRLAPGTWNGAVTQVTTGLEVTIIGCEDDSDGDMWYHVNFLNGEETVTGYIYETCVEIITDYEEDADFEKYLTEQGFPESYKPYLRSLHSLHPEWVFVADHLEMTWAEAVEGELALGRSVVSPNVSNAWKSMREDTYNWATGEWETWDSGGWVQAADSVVEYYLDPRNFLKSSDVFQFISMEYYPEVHTKENVLEAVQGTFMEGEFPEDTYESYADVLIAAAEESGVSPVSLASMIVVEQGSKGGGKCISGTVSGYEGYYNHYNIRAYRSGNYSAIQYGLLYAKGGNGTKADNYRPWNTRAKSIIGGACWYYENYVKRGQDTLYYKKFNVVSKPYFAHQYMTNVQGAASEAKKTADGYSKILDVALVFDIPVYKQMPETAAPYPTKTGSNDCYLKDLSVDSYSFTPSFNRYTNEYEFIVPASASSVVVTPLASDSSATVTGGGKVSLEYGNNTVEITVVSTSGVKNVYSLYIYRSEPDDAELSFNAANYTINGTYVSGIKPETTVETVITNFNIIGGSAVITKPDGSKPGVAGTGDTIEIMDNNGTVRYTYYILVDCDLNGDGRLSLVDVARMQNHLLRIKVLEGAQAAAADLNGDGRASLVDLARIQRKLLKIE